MKANREQESPRHGDTSLSCHHDRDRECLRDIFRLLQRHPQPGMSTAIIHGMVVPGAKHFERRKTIDR